ncbi:hypothetical protein TIFTF001_054304 [Ficus carica]|uniref:Uncharacterized protein n=1 Tax=Ficus carica TaxID=3494 RepID=A0AA88JIE3_FICCA|nr:hypothetical protein TIFTF001_054304 [Ficus carica]
MKNALLIQVKKRKGLKIPRQQRVKAMKNERGEQEVKVTRHRDRVALGYQ